MVDNIILWMFKPASTKITKLVGQQEQLSSDPSKQFLWEELASIVSLLI